MDLRARALTRRLPPILALPYELVLRVGEGRVLGIAAEMSFWIFLALLPLASVAGFVIARLAVGNWWAVSNAFAAVPAVTRDLLVNEISTVAAWKGEMVAPTAIVTFLWLASSGLHAVFDAMEIEAGCARPWWKKRLIALGACVVLPLGIGVLTLLGTGLDWTWRIAGRVSPLATELVNRGSVSVVLRFLSGAALLFGMVMATFVVGVPRAARREMPVVPGALLVVVLQTVFGFAYAWYISTVGTGGAYQAGLAVVGVTLMAVYVFSASVLIGLECNVMIRDHRRRHAAKKPSLLHPRVRIKRHLRVSPANR